MFSSQAHPKDEEETQYHPLEDFSTEFGDPEDGWTAWVRRYPSQQWIRSYKHIPWKEGSHSVLLFPEQLPGGQDQCRDYYTIEVLPGWYAEEFLIRFSVDKELKHAILDQPTWVPQEQKDFTINSEGTAEFRCRFVRNARGASELRCGNELVATVGRFKKGKGPWWIAGFAKMNGARLCINGAGPLGPEWVSGHYSGKEFTAERGDEDVGFLAVVKPPPSLFGKLCTASTVALFYADPFLQVNSFVNFVCHRHYGFAAIHGAAFVLCYSGIYRKYASIPLLLGFSKYDMLVKVTTIDNIQTGVINDWFQGLLQGDKIFEVFATLMIVPYSIIVFSPEWSISYGVMLLSHLSAIKTLVKNDEVDYELAFTRDRDLMLRNSPGDTLRFASRVALTSGGPLPTISVFFAVLSLGQLTWLQWSGLAIAGVCLAYAVFWMLPKRVFGDDANLESMRLRGSSCIQTKRCSQGPALNLWWTLAWVVFKPMLASIFCIVPGGSDLFLQSWHTPLATPAHLYISFWTLMSIVYPVTMLLLFCRARRGDMYPGLSFSAPLWPPQPSSVDHID